MQLLAVTVVVSFMAPVLGSPLVYEDKGSIRGPTSEEPAFCHDLDCPKYTVVEKHPVRFRFKHTARDRSVREIISDDYKRTSCDPKSTWAATHIDANGMVFTESDERELFESLHDYFYGNNTRHVEIVRKTTPVLRSVVPGSGPDSKSLFTTHFMIPFELQSNPPVPTDDRISISTISDTKMYVRSYGGFSNDTGVEDNLRELANDIRDPSKYKHWFYYIAEYDGPYQILDRHNEVWLRQDDD